MKNIFYKSIFLSLFLSIGMASFGQNKSFSTQNFKNPFTSVKKDTGQIIIQPKTQNQLITQKRKVKVEIINGSVYGNFEGEQISKEDIEGSLNTVLTLSDKHRFQKVSERTDEMGFTHINYQQQFNGIPVEGCIIMTHYKNDLATSLNGQIAEIEDIPTQSSITPERALLLAKEYLKVTNLINEYPVQLLIAGIPGNDGVNYQLAYKVRIDSWNPFTMCNIYVNAVTGKVINKISLIAHADTPATGLTLYSGTQSFTCDSYTGGYRLRESGRKIETYDATNATKLTISGFPGSIDFTSTSTTFTEVPVLQSFKISAVVQSWWYAIFVDQLPDLYIKVKDGSNNVVYTSGYFDNTFPPVTFNKLNIYLYNPPYTVEVWDYDPVGSDDFGGSYSISTSTGTKSWSGNGNNGTYTINSLGNLALDVHWGMEKTYDFYKNVFGRNSYDGAGSIIKQYVNPPTLQSQYGNIPNNASAYPAPYNLMVYGLGDGKEMNAVVGLDVEGHEFSHMVTENNGNGGLTYQGESGALNESFSDIFGTCVEFYSGVNPDWLIGEGVMVNDPFMRSMSNPKIAGQPNTYNSGTQNYWYNPNCGVPQESNDDCGVHINSGVQNYWFYLLSQGGSGTNDLGNAYSVTGIGITQARQIAYRNLITYLTPKATYYDSYLGSLQAAQDLYGNPSTQYSAVRAAWYAVGIGNNPTNYCSGTTYLTAASGTFTDGSGSANYQNNARCKWVIAPPGATKITLNFSSFSTEEDYDKVYVFDGPDTTATLLMTWWGNTLPPTINSSGGALCVKFYSDNTNTDLGWKASYTSTGITPTCDGGTVLSNPSGTFSDGSGVGNYGNNQLCYWYIAPPCAKTVTLSFSSFNTELNFDGVIVYDDISETNQIGVYSGSSIPSSVTSYTGEMLVIFVSDYSNTRAGFTANYTSTGSAHCSGVTTLNSSDNGTVSDGSGANDYCNNLNCQWLIQPPQAKTITLKFTEFELEEPSSDGKTVYDAVEIYDGTTTAAPLLGRFSGSNLPPDITSTGGSLLIRFYTDIEVVKQGWSAYYTSTTTDFCTGTTTLTAQNGTFADGSGTNLYGNNADCKWLIQPPGAASITLTFTSFDTEQNYDGVIVYDGDNTNAPQLGSFKGSAIPPSVTSTGGSMLIWFLSDEVIRKNGWSANYTSTVAAPVPSFTASKTTICVGDCIQFTDNSTNNPTSWLWSFPGATPSSSTVKNPTNICYNSTGVRNVSLTVTNSGGSNQKTENKYINISSLPTTPAITVAPSDKICEGESTTLTVTDSCTGCTYLWIPGNKSGKMLSVMSSGNYAVKATNRCGQISSNPVSIKVNPLPPKPEITVNGNQLQSSSATGNKWYFNGTVISGATEQTYLTQQSGNYYVIVTDANNCSIQSNTVNMTLTGIGLINPSSSFSIYPNPNDGSFEIRFSNSRDIVELQIFNAIGQKVFLDPHLNAKKVMNISLGELPEGIYFIQLFSKNGVEIKKFIINK